MVSKPIEAESFYFKFLSSGRKSRCELYWFLSALLPPADKMVAAGIAIAIEPEHKYKNTKMQKYTNTKMQKYRNTSLQGLRCVIDELQCNWTRCSKTLFPSQPICLSSAGDDVDEPILHILNVSLDREVNQLLH